MKRLSEFRGEEALDVLADLLDPATEIMTDGDLVSLFRERAAARKSKDFSRDATLVADAAKIALKKHPKAVLCIMARLEEVDPETYNPSLVQLPKMLVELFNDPELLDLFPSQGQIEVQTNSGSAMVNTEAHTG